jgi:uncharacterized protein YggT (Ycf19 family)
MTQVVKETRVLERGNGDETATAAGEPPSWTGARIVQIITGLVLSLLAIRFLLSLFGANQTNAFADFIYSVTAPLMAPFVGLFSYDREIGVARFEFEVFIAMAVYALIGWLITRVITVRTP